jgi:hypothetical protein
VSVQYAGKFTVLVGVAVGVGRGVAVGCGVDVGTADVGVGRFKIGRLTPDKRGAIHEITPMTNKMTSPAKVNTIAHPPGLKRWSQ